MKKILWNWINIENKLWFLYCNQRNHIGFPMHSTDLLWLLLHSIFFVHFTSYEVIRGNWEKRKPFDLFEENEKTILFSTNARRNCINKEFTCKFVVNLKIDEFQSNDTSAWCIFVLHYFWKANKKFLIKLYTYVACSPVD